MGASLPLEAMTCGGCLGLIPCAPYESPEAFYGRLSVASPVGPALYLLRIFITERE